MSDLISAVESGDQRAALEAIRARLAAELAGAEGRDAAAIAKELRAVLAELEALPGEEEDPVDQLAERRANRQADASRR